MPTIVARDTAEIRGVKVAQRHGKADLDEAFAVRRVVIG